MESRASTSEDITKVATTCSIYPQVLSIEWIPCLCPLNGNPNLSLSGAILSTIFCSLRSTPAMSAVSSAYLILFMFSLFIQIPFMSLASFTASSLYNKAKTRGSERPCLTPRFLPQHIYLIHCLSSLLPVQILHKLDINIQVLKQEH